MRIRSLRRRHNFKIPHNYDVYKTVEQNETKKLYTIRMLSQLDVQSRNGIRGTYYSPNTSKSDNIPPIDKSIKTEELKSTDLGKMLQALGYFKITAYVKPTALSKETNIDEIESFLDKLNNLDVTPANCENILNNKEIKLTSEEKDLVETPESFEQKVKIWRKKEKELIEKEARLQQEETSLKQRQVELKKRESKLQPKESSNGLNDDSDSKEHDVSLLESLVVPEQVTGITLRQSERTRLLSDDLERSRLILAAGKEICNKWLKVKQEIPDQEKAWT